MTWMGGEMNPWKTAERYPKRYYLFFKSAYDYSNNVLYKVLSDEEGVSEPYYEVERQKVHYRLGLIEKTGNIADWGLTSCDALMENGWHIYLMELDD